MHAAMLASFQEMLGRAKETHFLSHEAVHVVRMHKQIAELLP